jgi:hypothetical protein
MLSKYYSLDECYDKDKIFDYLEDLQNEELIYFEILDSDMIKIKDIGLSEKQIKELATFLDDNDAIDYPDFEEYNDESEDGDFDDDDYRPSDDYFF